MRPKTPTVCLIGAGISGLTAGKRLSDYGIEYDCCEISDRIGGNWAFGNPNGHSSAYWSLHIDTSKERLSFADLQIPAEFPDFPHHTQIKDYLERYAAAFDLKRRIRFRTEVLRCQRHPAGGWRVDTTAGRFDYDFLVVANGHHWDARYPDFPGKFEGESFHSHHYVSPRNPVDLHDKRVLVVGIGNSAADIAAEISQRNIGRRVVISTRSGAHILPKYALGRPLDRLIRTNPRIPLSWQRRAARLVPRLLVGDLERRGLPKPNHRFLEAHPTSSDELLLRLASGDVSVKPNVAELAGKSVVFADGTSELFDVVIYATGYNITFPFFDLAFISAPDNRLSLYKRMFLPDVDDLAFIGFAQALPTLFPFVEVQSGLLARYLAGTWRPPAPEEMRRVIRDDEKRFVSHFSHSARHTQQLDYDVYEHEVRTRLLPDGRRRVQELGPVGLAGRIGRPDAAVSA